MSIGVYCLNVGQGNCIAIVDPLPGGSASQFQASLIDVGCDGARLAAWLRSIGVVRIPLLVLTHNDQDHIRGLDALVVQYQRKIVQVRYVVDRDPKRISYFTVIQDWVKGGIVKSSQRLETPLESRPGMGATLVREPDTGYRLHCAFPNMHQNEAVLQRAPVRGPRLGRGPNNTSGVIRLALSKEPGRTRFLFGGDLNFPGWRAMSESGLDLSTDVLVAPHHGGPRGGSKDFGPTELTDATKARIVLFSVGTSQRHVRRSRELSARHPLPEVIQAFHSRKATVLCTQITRRCMDETLGNTFSVVSPPSVTEPHTLHPSGAACAGTILLVMRDDGGIEVSRLNDHQAAVDRLRATGHHPLCRT